MHIKLTVQVMSTVLDARP